MDLCLKILSLLSDQVSTTMALVSSRITTRTTVSTTRTKTRTTTTTTAFKCIDLEPAETTTWDTRNFTHISFLTTCRSFFVISGGTNHTYLGKEKNNVTISCSNPTPTISIKLTFYGTNNGTLGCDC